MRLVRSLVLSVFAAGALSACVYGGPYRASGAYYGSYGAYGGYPAYSGYGHPGYKAYRGYPHYGYYGHGGGCHHCGW
jgi:hypothetical protein